MIILPLFFAVVGLLLYVASTNGKVAEIGRIMFFCGMLAFLLQHPTFSLPK